MYVFPHWTPFICTRTCVAWLLLIILHHYGHTYLPLPSRPKSNERPPRHAKPLLRHHVAVQRWCARHPLQALRRLLSVRPKMLKEVAAVSAVNEKLRLGNCKYESRVYIYVSLKMFGELVENTVLQYLILSDVYFCNLKLCFWFYEAKYYIIILFTYKLHFRSIYFCLLKDYLIFPCNMFRAPCII